jgi:chromosome segregation ATPase
MKENANKSTIKEEARALRKKVTRIEKSRSSIKAKSQEKGKIIKAYQDRQIELEQNRDDWKRKCKGQEKECISANNKYKQVADMLEMKENELRQILQEFEELKKKYPHENRRKK